MRRFLRRLPILVVLALVIGATVMAFQPKPVPVDIVRVRKGPLQVSVDENGQTRIRDRYVVSAPLAGRLLRIELEPGDEVTAEATELAIIEPTDPSLLDERTREESQARSNAAAAAVKKFETMLSKTLAAHRKTESEFARAKKMRDENVINEQQFEDAEHAMQLAADDFRAAQFNKEIAEFEHQLAMAAFKRFDQPTSTDNNAHLTIQAPVSGVVLRVFQESKTVVTPGMRLIEVGDTTDLELVIDVLSTDAVNIEPGQPVVIEHWGGSQPLSGEVKRVEPSAFTKVSALGVEEQRVNVIVKFTDPVSDRAGLGDGFRVEARIVTWEHSEVLKVPTSSLFRRGENWAVFVVNDGKAQLRVIEIGRRNSLEAEVKDGLDVNQQVIQFPSDRVKDGIEIVERD